MGVFKKYYTARTRPPPWLKETGAYTHKDRKWVVTLQDTVLKEIEEDGAATLCTADLYEYLGMEDNGGGFVDYDAIAELAEEKGLTVNELASDEWEVSKEEVYND